MKFRQLRVAGLVFAALLWLTPAANAAVLIDFGTGLAGSGGTITTYSDGSISGAGVLIGSLIVSGAGAAVDGTYVVTGGLLNFATGGLSGTNSITIDGAITLLGLSFQNLLSGTFASYSMVPTGPYLAGVMGSGIDTKSPNLLSALGYAPGSLSFGFFGFSVGFNPTGTGNTYIAQSSDISNVGVPVPEPGALLLLGSGLLGAVALVRRRRPRER